MEGKTGSDRWTENYLLYIHINSVQFSIAFLASHNTYPSVITSHYISLLCLYSHLRTSLTLTEQYHHHFFNYHQKYYTISHLITSHSSYNYIKNNYIPYFIIFLVFLPYFIIFLVFLP